MMDRKCGIKLATSRREELQDFKVVWTQPKPTSIMWEREIFH